MSTLAPPDWRKTHGIIRRGVSSDRPAADTCIKGTLWIETDTLLMYRSNQVTWDEVQLMPGTGIFTPGSVIFAGPTGMLNADAGQFFFDDANNVLRVQKEVGGTDVTDGLALQSTTGNGTSRADFVRFLLGNNGSVDAARWINNGGAGFLLINEAALKYTAVASAKGGVELHVETDVNFATTPSISIAGGIAFQAYDDAVANNVPFEFRGKPIGFTIGLSLFTQHFARSSYITPSALAAGNNNDYNPTGLGGETGAGAYCLRLTGDAGGTSKITGIDGGLNYTYGGRELLLINVGTFQIEIMHEDANSAADNRIILPIPSGGGGSTILNENDSCKLWYDSSTAMWRMVDLCR